MASISTGTVTSPRRRHSSIACPSCALLQQPLPVAVTRGRNSVTHTRKAARTYPHASAAAMRSDGIGTDSLKSGAPGGEASVNAAARSAFRKSSSDEPGLAPPTGTFTSHETNARSASSSC